VDVGRGDAPNSLPPSPVFTAKARETFSSFLASAWAPVSSSASRTAATLFERLDLLAIGRGERHRLAAGQEEIARVSGADFDLIAFAAETVDGFD
jgi:hypothetical protein